MTSTEPVSHAGPVAVLGARGFVGSAVVAALAARGIPVVRVTAARLPPLTAAQAGTVGDDFPDHLDRLARDLAGCAAVVNAAGLAAPISPDARDLIAANAALPLLVVTAARRAGATRFIQVSSAAVQGSRPVLDDSWEHAARSPYARSKALGENLIRANGRQGDCRWTIYRPGGVHGAGRQVTRTLARVAASPLASVLVGPSPTPLALIGNVGDAVAFLATCAEQPPEVVTHPSEGVTTVSVLRDLGGREPRIVPAGIGRSALAVGRLAGRVLPPAAGVSRRLETLWLGQRQTGSWLTRAGWTPPVGAEGWTALACGR